VGTFSKNWSGDPEVRAALDWFLEFINPSEWQIKREKIDNYIKNVLETKKHPIPLASDSARVIYPFDKFAWYLYLAESYDSHIEDYEFSQGARIIPLFKILGKHLKLLKQVSGVEDVISAMIELKNDNPDGALFELIVALLYLRNGWEKVEFLPESSADKTPDIHVVSELGEFFIECKRLSKSSDYSEKERIYWLEMCQPLQEYLAVKRRPLIIDIIFHVELSSLNTSYIERELLPKLDFVYSGGVVIENETWKVTVETVDFDRIEKHMKSFSVKIPSTSLIDLIFKSYDPGRGYTPIIIGKTSPINNTYIDHIVFAAGAVWSCDAENAIQKKLRHILRHLSEACSQLPVGFPGIVHIGLESHDGAIVENERFRKIINKTLWFDSREKDLHWIYCHIFDPRVPPDDNWDFGETVVYFSGSGALKEPLTHKAVALPDDAKTHNGVFWS
jgi:hypothetical protein